MSLLKKYLSVSQPGGAGCKCVTTVQIPFCVNFKHSNTGLGAKISILILTLTLNKLLTLFVAQFPNSGKIIMYSSQGDKKTRALRYKAQYWFKQLSVPMKSPPCKRIAIFNQSKNPYSREASGLRLLQMKCYIGLGEIFFPPERNFKFFLKTVKIMLSWSKNGKEEKGESGSYSVLYIHAQPGTKMRWNFSVLKF